MKPSTTECGLANLNIRLVNDPMSSCTEKKDMMLSDPPICATISQPSAPSPASLTALRQFTTKIPMPKKPPPSKAQSFTEGRLSCSNEPLNITTPLVKIPAKIPDKTVTIQVLDSLNATGHENYLMTNQIFRVNFNQPILRLADEGQFSSPLNSEWNVYSTGQSRVVRVVWENQKFDPSQPGFDKLTFAHPLHMHGHDYQVLSSGTGPWDGTIVNADNPLRRDPHIMPPNGHLVVQFETDNPGVWPFQCHIACHTSAGFLVNFLERPSDVPKRKGIGRVMKETCTAWDAWNSQNVVSQIDRSWRLKEGLKERT